MMSLLKKWPTLLLCLVALAAAGCRKEGGRAGAGKEGKLRVGFSQMESNGPWRIAETRSMRDEAAKRAERFELVVTDARGDLAVQVANVEDLIAQRVDAIFLAPQQEKGFEGVLQSAREQGIPVFLLDREVEGTAGRDFAGFIGSNFVEEGKRAGEWLVRRTGGKAGIIELLGTAGSSVARDRHDGFAAAIKSSPDMKILASQTANFTRAEGQKVMEKLIQAHGRDITAVYAQNDEMALGAIQALKDAGFKPGKEVLIVSVDGQRSALEAIMRGELNVTVECNPRFGPIAFDTLEKYLRGEQIPPKIIVPDRFFDSSNAAQYVNEAY